MPSRAHQQRYDQSADNHPGHHAGEKDQDPAHLITSIGEAARIAPAAYY